MQHESIDAVFVLQNADLYYFSGTVQAGLLCLCPYGDPVYLVNKSITRARIESPWERIVPLATIKDTPGILEREGLGRLRRIGLELDVLPANHYFRFRELFPSADFVDASETIRKLRMVKSPYEVDQVRHAAYMLTEAWERLPAWIRPGATELEVLAQLEGFLRLQGHQGIQRTRGFNSEIGYGAFSAGANACYPTAFPGAVGYLGLYPAIPNSGSQRCLLPGEPLMVDISGGYGGYLADAARTFIIGNPAPEMSDAHEFVLELNDRIESMLKPGVACRQIYSDVLDRVSKSPYMANFMGVGENHVRFVGHGVGLELDELPVLAPRCDIELAAGMTISVEPKIFFPDRGGVGIENVYLITGSGFEKLTQVREEIIRVSQLDS